MNFNKETLSKAEATYDLDWSDFDLNKSNRALHEMQHGPSDPAQVQKSNDLQREDGSNAPSEDNVEKATTKGRDLTEVENDMHGVAGALLKNKAMDDPIIADALEEIVDVLNKVKNGEAASYQSAVDVEGPEPSAFHYNGEFVFNPDVIAAELTDAAELNEVAVDENQDLADLVALCKEKLKAFNAHGKEGGAKVYNG